MGVNRKKHKVQLAGGLTVKKYSTSQKIYNETKKEKREKKN